MLPKHSYWHYQSVLTPEQCDRILQLGESEIKRKKDLGESTKAITWGNMEKGGHNAGAQSRGESDLSSLDVPESQTYIRDSEVAWLSDTWLFDLIAPYIRGANIQAGWNYDIDVAEDFQFTKYSHDGFYGWHQDSNGGSDEVMKRFIPGVSPLDPNTGRRPTGYTEQHDLVGKVRKISATINISPENSYEGGNLKFDFGPHSDPRYHECLEIRPRGSIIVFPSYMYHCVTPVTKGTRYSLVMWNLGKPFK